MYWKIELTQFTPTWRQNFDSISKTNFPQNEIEIASVTIKWDKARVLWSLCISPIQTFIVSILRRNSDGSTRNFEPDRKAGFPGEWLFIAEFELNASPGIISPFLENLCIFQK